MSSHKVHTVGGPGGRGEVGWISIPRGGLRPRRPRGTAVASGGVNKWHELLRTPEWAAFLHEEILPAVTHGVDLGADLLEIGPGPGASTEWLRHRVSRLVALEIEPEAAEELGQRFAGTNVEAVTGDATALTYPDESFDTVGMFTMLHHVPTRAMQDAILAGALRVLRPGGTLIGSDSLASDRLHQHHEGDTYNPVEPAAFLTRLQTIGFGEITLTVSDRLLFRARKPAPA
jgi:SAM-dependent methyltransferase